MITLRQLGSLFYRQGLTCPKNTYGDSDSASYTNDQGQTIAARICKIDDWTKPVSYNGGNVCVGTNDYLVNLNGSSYCLNTSQSTVYTSCPNTATMSSGGQISCGNGDGGVNDKKRGGASGPISDQSILKECAEKGIISLPVSRPNEAKAIEHCKSELAKNGNQQPGTNTAETAEDPAAAANTANYCNQQYQTLKEQLDKQCRPQKKKANYCCSAGGVGCLAGFEANSTEAALTTVGTMLATTLAGMRQMQGMAQNCDSQSGLANFSAGLNASMAANCQMEKNSCENICENLRIQIISARDQCNQGSGVTNIGSAYNQLEQLAKDANAEKNSCEQLINNVVSMGTQSAVTMITTAQAAKLCKDVVAASPPPVAPGIPGNDLCNDPSDLSNPYCRQQFCSQPGTANLPECQGSQTGNQKLGGGSGGGSSFTTSSYGNRGTGGTGIDDAEVKQGPGIMPVEITPNSVAQTQGGTTGGVPGGGSGGGGGESGYDTAGGGSQKLNTGILQGFSSGSGYSVTGTGFSNEGGYSNPTGGGGGGDNKQAPFDLKQFLPKVGPKRELAGFNHGQNTGNPELANKHDNLFERISNKYRDICRRGMAIGCEKPGQK